MAATHPRRRRAPPAILPALALALCTFMAWPLSAPAGEAKVSISDAPLMRVDWQGPLSLPPRFRNHCTIDPVRGAYCSNHCGLDYQLYYCSQGSFGCCRPGRGYCGWDGLLRCAP